MIRLALALALLLAAAPAAAQSPDRYRPPNAPDKPVKREGTGAVPTPSRYSIGSVIKGDRAPDFELALAGGGKAQLSSFRGQWVVVCFCPQRNYAAIDSVARGVPDRVPVLGVVPEKAGTLTAWSAQNKPSALLLDDSMGDIAALYGAWDLERGEPRAGYVIVDPKGFVTRVEFTHRLEPVEAVRAVQYAVTGL